MKTDLFFFKAALLGIGIAPLAIPVHAADQFFFNTAASVTAGSYKDSLQRNKFSEYGMKVSGDYLDQGGVTAGYSSTKITLKSGAPATEQNNFMLSGRLHIRPDALPGRLTLRLDGYRVNNNDGTRNTGPVTVFAPQVGWLSKDGTVYADLGYADSRYQNQLTVHQYTPTLGFGFNAGADWIQFRSYQIRGLNPARAVGKSSTSGLDFKWTHSFAPGSALMPSFLSLGIAAGERIYAVDMDIQSVANLADLEKGAVNFGIGWKITKSTKLFLLAGQSRFRNVTLANDYKLNLGHAGLSVDW